MKKLGKICHKCAEKAEQTINEKDHQQLNIEIEQINSKYKLQIDRITKYTRQEKKERILKHSENVYTPKLSKNVRKKIY